jgi:OOP family OmpA-OmpF porin
VRRFAPLTLAALAACAQPGPQQPISAFEAALAEGYRALAEDEFNEADILDGRRFRRAQRAAEVGDPPPPDDLAERALDPELRTTLEAARERLIAAQDEIARLIAPAAAAEAQTAFDCWVQEAEEGLGQPEAETCREDFFERVAELETAGGELVVLLPGQDDAAVSVGAGGDNVVLDAPLQAAVSNEAGVAETPQLDARAVEKALSAAAGATPAPFESYLVFFETGGADITADSRDAFESAVSDAQVRGEAARVTVFGHTDTVGSQAVNARVSVRRAAAVAALLVDAGIPAESVGSDSFGETRLLVETADGVAEPRNRRVEIVVR